MALENIFSEGNILEYGRAAVDLAIDMQDLHKKTMYDTIMLPSRGALPIFIAAKHALDRLAQEHPDFKRFHNSLRIDYEFADGLIEPVPISDGNQQVNILLCPFTADLNMTQYDRRLDNDEFIDRTRRYWAEVTSAFFLDKDKRRSSPYFCSLVDLILREIEGRERLAKAYEQFPKISKIVMVDTVISGRASSTILDCFDDIRRREGVPCFPFSFLVVDENGNKLREEYSNRLRRFEWEQWENECRTLTKYKVPRIVSEDEGASLEGVAAFVYPNFMCPSENLFYQGRPFFIGAGSWHHVDAVKYYMDNFKKFMDLINSAVDLDCAERYDIGEQNSAEREFNRNLRDFVGFAKKREIFNKRREDIKELGLPSMTNRNIKRVYETGSHVVHIEMDSEYVNLVLNGFVNRHPELIRLD